MPHDAASAAGGGRCRARKPSKMRCTAFFSLPPPPGISSPPAHAATHEEELTPVATKGAALPAVVRRGTKKRW